MPLNIHELRDVSELDALPWFAALRATASATREQSKTVAKIIADVQKHGDKAVARYMRKWTDRKFNVRKIRVGDAELAGALRSLGADLRAALEGAIANVRAYQQHIRPADPPATTIAGAELGLRFTPVSSVGLIVPGGKAAYPSTVIMLAVPALAAGVPPEAISVVSPPPSGGGGDVSPLVLATCALLGLKHVYRVGGAQAVAALAIGTATIAPVDFIAGPGNVYTQLAKQQFAGRVGIDGFYGPSEVVVIADESADPRKVAADLLAQAEHDPGKCFLVSWSRRAVETINRAMDELMRNRKRQEAIRASLEKESAAVLVRDESAAIEVADRIAAEHVNLAVADPAALLKKLRHGGEYFLGDTTPVAAGDYWAGPSHCLPTGTTARFASGVSVYTFLKRSGTVRYPGPMPAAAIDAITHLAEAEGLDAHAQSVRQRRC